MGVFPPADVLVPFARLWCPAFPQVVGGEPPPRPPAGNRAPGNRASLRPRRALIAPAPTVPNISATTLSSWVGSRPPSVPAIDNSSRAISSSPPDSKWREQRFPPSLAPCSLPMLKYGPRSGGLPTCALSLRTESHHFRKGQSTMATGDETKSCGHGPLMEPARRSRSGDLALAELGLKEISGWPEDPRCPGLIVGAPPRQVTARKSPCPGARDHWAFPATCTGQNGGPPSRTLQPPSAAYLALGLLQHLLQQPGLCAASGGHRVGPQGPPSTLPRACGLLLVRGRARLPDVLVGCNGRGR